MKPHIVIICGTTGSGKTSLALKLASSLPTASIISFDSRQAYRNLDQLTGKDIPPSFVPCQSSLTYQQKPVSYLRNKSVNLWGVDFIDPDLDLNLSHFVDFAWAIVRQELSENRSIILVGGTGLYLKAFSTYSPEIHIPKDEALRQDLKRLSLVNLQQKYQQVNPKGFASLNPSDLHNPRRLVRRIEQSLSSPRRKLPEYHDLQKNTDFLWLGLRFPLPQIKEAIQHRVEARLKAGAVEEVAKLLKEYPNTKLPVYTSLGVSQIISYLNGEISLSQLTSLWTQAEYAYAKRQLTWLKKQPSIIWYDNTIDRGLIVNKTIEWL